MRSAVGDDHLVGIRVHDEVGLVRDNDDLSARSCSLKPLDEVFKNGFGVEIFLRLVNYQRSIVIGINCDVKK
jgi:hypothetical protein